MDRYFNEMERSMFLPFSNMNRYFTEMERSMFLPFANNRYFAEMEQNMSEQFRSISVQLKSPETLLEEARQYVLSDPKARSLLGEEIRVGAPYGRSSSSTTINGVNKSRLTLVAPCTGTLGRGDIRLIAAQESIECLEVTLNGRTVKVQLDNNQKEDFIDANVIDKDFF